ncbi:unnamed protein product [Calypogeia fissa]
MASVGLMLVPPATAHRAAPPCQVSSNSNSNSSSTAIAQERLSSLSCLNGGHQFTLDLGASARPRGVNVVASRQGYQPMARASANGEEEKGNLSRRELLGGVSGGLLSLALVGSSTVSNVGSAIAEDELEDWERVPLPVDKGVVLVDLAFVPDEPEHGFLLGTRQTLLETKDGGKFWIPRTIPTGEDDFNFRLNSISFQGKEGWIVGKPAILLHTTNSGESWERVPLSARLPGNPVIIKATGEKSAEMVTDEGAIYVTSNNGYNWKAAVAETVSATLNRTLSSDISGASYYNGTFNTVNRSTDGGYVAVSSRGNFFLTWEPGQPFWQPHNRTSARRIQSMGWRADGGLWLLVRGGGLFFSKGTGITEDFEEAKITSRGFGILDIGYRTPDEAWAVGGSGTLLRSLDGGKSWVRDKAADDIGANLYTVKFIDPKKGFIIGNDGVLLRYLG